MAVTTYYTCTVLDNEYVHTNLTTRVKYLLHLRKYFDTIKRSIEQF